MVIDEELRRDAEILFWGCPELTVLVPYQTLWALWSYALDRVPVGHFLEAVLTNDLAGACAAADSKNGKALADIVKFIYNCLPSISWGSPEKYHAWLADK